MTTAALGLALMGCSAKSPQAHQGVEHADPHRCPSADASLPAFTTRLGSKVTGRLLVVCQSGSKANHARPEPFRFTAAWIQLASVDGMRLPARVNLDPQLPRGLQRMSDCSVQPEGRFNVFISGQWFAARSAGCATNF